MHPALQVLVALLSTAGVIIGSLVLLNLRSLITRMNSFDARITSVETRQAKLTDRFTDKFVDKIDYIRNVNKQEKTLDSLVRMVSEMKGLMKAIEQMPQICGNIAREIVKEMK